jgi:hypothetical protein
MGSFAYTVSMLLLISSIAFGSEINSAITTFNQYSQFEIPLLSPKELTDLTAGTLVKRIDSGKTATQPTRAIAYVLSSHSQEDLWLASQDEHLVTKDQVEYFLLERNKQDQTKWYAFMDLPWPIDDRHWATASLNNHRLAQETKGQMWEHSWKLEDNWKQYQPTIDNAIEKKLLDSVTTEMISEAIYLPESQGAWAIIGLANSTLMIYHATANAGGYIPTDILLSFLLRSLDDLFSGVEYNAQNTIDKHYTSGHYPIYDGFGRIIPTRAP